MTGGKQEGGISTGEERRLADLVAEVFQMVAISMGYALLQEPSLAVRAEAQVVIVLTKARYLVTEV